MEVEPNIASDRFMGTMATEDVTQHSHRNLEESPLPQTTQPGRLALISMGPVLGATYEWTQPVGSNNHRFLQENPIPAVVVRPR